MTLLHLIGKHSWKKASWYGVLLPREDRHSLARLLGMTVGNLQQWLVREGLGQHRGNKFCPRKVKTEESLPEYEFTEHRYKGENQWFILIGIRKVGCPLTPGHLQGGGLAIITSPSSTVGSEMRVTRQSSARKIPAMVSPAAKEQNAKRPRPADDDGCSSIDTSTPPAK